jgi:hypothetical protein
MSDCFLSKRDIQRHHDREAEHGAQGSGMGMSLGL